jgi:RNA-directed DNA polymerase
MNSKKQLLFTLGYSFKELCSISDEIDRHYYAFEKKKIKSDGTIKIRKIEPSHALLKSIQSKILKNILEKIELLPCVQGGVKSKSNIDNARLHLGKKYHLCTDLKDFFPSVSHHKVFKMFRNRCFSNEIAGLLTKLTTFKGKLPQGTPTSTYIANLILYETDLALLEFCARNEIVYSRYVDDLVFSSQSDFKIIQDEIFNIINESGFKRSQKKTFYKIGPVEITGILVKHNALKPTKTILEKLQNTSNEASKKGLENYIKSIH